MNLLRSHGITRDDKEMTEDPHGSWYYQQIDLGFNYRMTDLQAALGISQLKRIDEYISTRHNIAAVYDKAFEEKLPINIPKHLDNTYSSYHLYVIRLQLNNITRTHKDFFEELKRIGIGVNLHYIPVHLHPYYRNLGFKNGDFPNAENYYREAISIPVYPGLSSEDQAFIIESIKNIASGI
jgi:dTDP-4-amino-4,6-dideoxygalactose transaminase